MVTSTGHVRITERRHAIGLNTPIGLMNLKYPSVQDSILSHSHTVHLTSNLINETFFQIFPSDYRWDTELVIDESEQEPEVYEKV